MQGKNECMKRREKDYEQLHMVFHVQEDHPTSRGGLCRLPHRGAAAKDKAQKKARGGRGWPKKAASPSCPICGGMTVPYGNQDGIRECFLCLDCRTGVYY
jgi:hypothetical protein